MKKIVSYRRNYRKRDTYNICSLQMPTERIWWLIAIWRPRIFWLNPILLVLSPISEWLWLTMRMEWNFPLERSRVALLSVLFISFTMHFEYRNNILKFHLQRYLSPEVLTNTIKNDIEHYKLSDMYSFGLIVWECTRRTDAVVQNGNCFTHHNHNCKYPCSVEASPFNGGIPCILRLCTPWTNSRRYDWCYCVQGIKTKVPWLLEAQHGKWREIMRFLL